MSEVQEVLTGGADAIDWYIVDETRLVRFEAEKLAELDEDGVFSQRLFRTPDGRLIAHVTRQAVCYDLVAVSEADLQPGGRFPALGALAGFCKPLTLDEALAR